jgi:hypothetical protein
MPHVPVSQPASFPLYSLCVPYQTSDIEEEKGQTFNLCLAILDDAIMWMPVH